MRINPISLYQNRINTNNTQKNNTSKPVSFSGVTEMNKNHYVLRKAEELKQEFQLVYDKGISKKNGVKEYSAACGKEYITLDDENLCGEILRKTAVFEGGKLYEIVVSIEDSVDEKGKEAYYFDTKTGKLKEYHAENKKEKPRFRRCYNSYESCNSDSSVTQTFYKF